MLRMKTQTDTLNSNEEQNEIENPVNVDASNVDIEDKPIEEMIQLINNNQRDIFVEMNKYNESQIHNLIDENEQIWSAINKQMEINEDIEKRFHNRLKLQRQIFEEMIEEQSTYFKLQLKTITPCIMCVQYIGGCSVHRGVFSTSGGYHEYIGRIP